jgi:tetratricopeptide (TPR) repeat protein
MAKQSATAHELFRRLAEKGTTPDEYRVLVAAYRAADRPKELLDLLDRLYKAVRPDGGEETKPDAKINPDALTRSRLLTQAVRQLKPTFTDRLVTEATANLPGTVRHTDTLELLYGLGRREGVLGKTTDLLQASAKKRPKDYRLKALTVGALAELRQWRTITDIALELSEFDNGMRYYPSIRAEAAVAYAELGEKAAALQLLKQLGETPYTQTQRARVLNVLGDHAAALKACDEGLTNDKLTATEQRSLLVAKATALNHLKKYAEAEAIWRELLDADPDNVLALNNLGYELADQNRKLDEAEALLRRAIDLDRWERGRSGDPDAENSGYLDSLGWVLFRQGKLKEARALLEKAVAMPESAGDGIVWDHLGDVAFRQGEKKRAAEAWRQAAKLFENTHLGREKGRLDEVKAKVKLADK